VFFQALILHIHNNARYENGELKTYKVAGHLCMRFPYSSAACFGCWGRRRMCSTLRWPLLRNYWRWWRPTDWRETEAVV